MSGDRDSFDFRSEKDILRAMEERIERLELRVVSLQGSRRGEWRLWAILAVCVLTLLSTCRH